MDCIFCKIAHKEIPSEVLYEDDSVMAIMDINPLCDGHVLIIPKKHYENLYEVDNDTLTHMFEVAKNLNKKIMSKLNETGATFSINYGTKQEVKHLHLHILPDFKKKPTRSIEEVYNLLKED